MALFDKVKETAQKGVDKTKEAVSTGQDMLEERKLEKQISDLKEELGGLVYGQKTGAPADNAESRDRPDRRRDHRHRGRARQGHRGRSPTRRTTRRTSPPADRARYGSTATSELRVIRYDTTA